MRNIYIETDENFRVTKIHRMPFDPNNGMGYTREELEKKGFFVEDVPNPINQTGKRAIAMYNPDTKSIFYEYASIPMSDKERVDQLENLMNWFMMNATYGINPYATATMSLDEPVEKPKYNLSVQEEKAAEYLACQIISGKLELNQCLAMFPQFEEKIKSVLLDNGIQV